MQKQATLTTAKVLLSCGDMGAFIAYKLAITMQISATADKKRRQACVSALSYIRYITLNFLTSNPFTIRKHAIPRYSMQHTLTMLAIVPKVNQLFKKLYL